MDYADSSYSWGFQVEEEPCSSSYDSNWMIPNRGARICGAEGSTSNQARLKAISYFTEMGFVDDLVIKTIDEKGEENTEAILEILLAHPAHEECSARGGLHLPYPSSLEYEWDSLHDLSDFSDEESYLQNEENLEPLPETKKMQLVAMGFSAREVSAAIDSNDPYTTTVTDLMDHIYAAQMGETTSDHPCELPLEGHGPDVKKKKLAEQERKIRAWRSNRKVETGKRKRHSLPDEDEASMKAPRVMVGFGVPMYPRIAFNRKLPDVAVAPPFFYFENHLFNIEPEFVYSKYFCASTRKRGYIHNLPIEDRFPLLPVPPLTIKGALPYTCKWWPSWDVRSQFNCLLTATATAQETDRIRKDLKGWQGEPPEHIRKKILKKCRKWNLNHTSGIPYNARYKTLGNSFQVHSVAYHLSVLKNRFPGGIKVLSLFTGIGGAEIALHQLGIPLNIVVSVEKSGVSRKIFQNWWNNTNQQGVLIHDTNDVRKLDEEKLKELVQCCGGFDLVVGGSPCDNITGSNRVTHDGLDGEKSVLFYDFRRILNTVIRLMREHN
ncbi:hypothetical protein MKX03_025273 [Papaver bracteatum]|nr:hypothetical protein MKX03_025273 [Papaver bracteatum]